MKRLSRYAPRHSPQLGSLARALVHARRLEESQAIAINAQALLSKTSFVAALIEHGSIEPEALAHFIAVSFGYPLIDLRALDPQALPRGLLHEDVMYALCVLPLARRGMQITLAMGDPTDMAAREAIRVACGLNPDPVVARQDVLAPMVTLLSADYCG